MTCQPLHPTRRDMLARGLALLGTAATTPVLLGADGPALTGADPTSRQRSDGDRVLALVHLAGGNDGLNTVIPYENDLYYRCRPRIAIAKRNVLPLDRELGLHPAARGLKELFDEGKLAIVQGVGCPDPSRNHFDSTAIWHAGDPRPTRCDARLGRQAGAGGRGSCRLVSVTGSAGASPSRFGQRRGSTRGAPRQHVHRQDLAHSLALVARMVAADSPRRVYHVSLGGFDTHTDQAVRHARLLGQFSTAMKLFVGELQAERLLDGVLVLAFSEFGRRVAENAGGGTDHGEAGPVFLIGPKLYPGVHEQHPSLANLHRGALRFGCDFRRVYAAVLRDWLATRSERVPGSRFRALKIIRAK